MQTRSPSLDGRIRSEIEAKIHSGEWPPGHRLPTERVLQAQYGCARATVGKAMAALASAGLVNRRKKAGTFVAHPPVHAGALTIPDIAEVISGRGEAYRFHLLAHTIRTVQAHNPDEQMLLASGRILALVGLHTADDRPFAVEHRLISLEQVPEAELTDFSHQAPGTWLLSQIPWTKARHHISALGCGDPDAAQLQIAAGAPCLRLDRWTWREEQGVTFVRQIFPAPNYSLVAEFTPSRPI